MNQLCRRYKDDYIGYTIDALVETKNPLHVMQSLQNDHIINNFSIGRHQCILCHQHGITIIPSCATGPSYMCCQCIEPLVLQAQQIINKNDSPFDF
ncbi:MAG TPA: hypothetical protein VLG50_02120 [Candidatus Saccharimonadales bacterium]|nr:hypothetical protein [Candidatus Saccharimonadales bacterium]